MSTLEEDLRATLDAAVAAGTILPGYTITTLKPPYVCVACGASGVRLYRRYQCCADAADLKCRPCAEDEQHKQLESLRAMGLGRSPYEIGWRVLAVPTDDGSFWGYTSIPADRLAWWKALQLRRVRVHAAAARAPAATRV